MSSGPSPEDRFCNSTYRAKVPYFRAVRTLWLCAATANVLFFSCFLQGLLFAQPAGSIGVLPKKFMILTPNLDSLVRSYSKKGFTQQIGRRDVSGILSNYIYLESGFEIELAAPSPGNPRGWETAAVQKYGAHMASIRFETNDPDSLYKVLIYNRIPCLVIRRGADSAGHVEAFALDSCHPLDIVFERTHRLTRRDEATKHANGVYRLDWLLLSCGDRIKEIMTQILDLTGAIKMHQGCCDFWQMGTHNDITLTRFEPIPLKVGKDPYWFSVEVDNFYWAY